MNATSVWSIRVAKTVGTRDGQAGFSAASVPRQANKTKQTTNKNFIFFVGRKRTGKYTRLASRRSTGRQKLEMQEPGKVSRLGVCMCAGRKEEAGKGEKL